MGTFLTNVHIQTTSPEQVIEAMQSLEVRGAWLSGPNGPWITLWDSMGLTRSEEVAQHLSRQLEAPVITFMVHDSDILMYQLYDNGQMLDEYNSCPGYFDGDASMEEASQADCETLKRYCRSETTKDELESLLKVWTQAEALEGITSKYVFEEQRLVELAKHLDIPANVVGIDYGDIGRDVHPDEVKAKWIGEGDPSDHPGMFDMDGMMEEGGEFDAAAGMVSFPASPLHTAVLSDDLKEIERVVAEGNDIDETNSVYPMTALTLAAASVSPKTLARMLALGADVNASSNPPGSISPIRSAVMAGKTENVRILLEHGADAQDFNPSQGTLLHDAAARGTREIAELLVEKGVDPAITNAAGQTPLELLRSHQARLNQALETFGGKNMPQEMKDLMEGIKAMEEYLDSLTR